MNAAARYVAVPVVCASMNEQREREPVLARPPARLSAVGSLPCRGTYLGRYWH